MLNFSAIVLPRKEESPRFLRLRLYCDPAGIRTQDPYIKSVLLYQLSYRIIKIVSNCGISVIEVAKVTG